MLFLSKVRKFARVAALPTLFCSLLLFDATQASAQYTGQLEGNAWTFGTGNGTAQPRKLTWTPPFTSYPTLTAVTGLGTSTQIFYGGEGAATLFDPITGNVIGYCEGTKLWSANGTLATNGTGLNGKMTPRPAFFIVSPDCTLDTFMLITMNTGQVNGGGSETYDWIYSHKVVRDQVTGNLTVVTGAKNIALPLPAGYTSAPDAAEGLELVPKGNAYGYWLIAREYNTGKFFVYDLSASGPSNLVTISYHSSHTVTSTVCFHTQTRWNRQHGTNSRIAVTDGIQASGSGKIFSMAFNTNTGTLSGFTTHDSNPENFIGIDWTNSIDWSPDGTKLYYCHWREQILYQYDLSTSTRHTVYSGTGALQDQGNVKLGPDGKIYHTQDGQGSGFIGVIDNPNLAANAAGFLYNSTAIATPSNYLHYALGDAWNMPIKTATLVQLPNNGCSGGDLSVSPAGLSVTWRLNGNTIPGATGSTITPTSLGTYVAVVSDSAGCVLVSNPLTVVTSGGPNVNAAASATTLPCTGGQVTLTSTGASTYAWSGAGLVSTTGNSVTANVNATTTFQVIGTTTGCSDTAFVTVTVPPQITVTASASSTALGCNGGQVTLTATGATTYTWSGAGLVTTTGNSVTANVSNTTTYQVIGTSSGCSDTATVTISVPGAINVAASTSLTTLPCTGGQITLSATGGTTYAWSGAGLVSTSGSPVTANVNATTTFQVIGTTSGCSDTALVTVTVAPQINVNAAASATTLPCTGGTVTLTSTGASTYAWSGAGLVSTTGNSVTANVNATTTFQVIGTTTGCSDTAFVTVTVPPQITVTASASSTALGCNGGQVTLTATGATTYTWSGAGLVTTTGNSVTANVTNTTTYQVIGNTNGCLDTATVQVFVQPPLNIVLTASQTQLPCGGGPITLTANGAAGYVWSGPNITANFGNSITANPTTTTTYQVIGQTQTCSDTVSITINVGLAGAVTAIASPTTLNCPGGLVNLTATGAATYQWTGNGLVSTTGPAVTANITSTTTFQVIGFDASGQCSDTSLVTVTVTSIPVPLVINVSPAAPHCVGDTLTFTAFDASGNAPTNATWQTNGFIISQSSASLVAVPVLSLPTMTVTVAGQSNGCPAADTLTLAIADCQVIDPLEPDSACLYIPNTFSPNADIINDSFGIVHCGFTNFSFYIFNRWGQQLYESNDPNFRWDGQFNGRPVQTGTYFYLLKATAKSQEFFRQGPIYVVR